MDFPKDWLTVRIGSEGVFIRLSSQSHEQWDVALDSMIGCLPAANSGLDSLMDFDDCKIIET